MNTRRILLQAGVAAASSSVFGAFARDARPLSLIVGFPPGGSPDLVVRTLAERLSARLARPVIVENKVGAGGQIALASLMTGQPDGSAYVLTPETIITSTPLLYSKLAFDPAQIEPVVTVCKVEQGVAAALNTPVKTLAELISWMKDNPAKALYGIPAAGSTPHFVGMLLTRAAGINAQSVLYRGGPPMVADLLGGQIPSAVNVLFNFIEHHRSGKLRVLATSGATRSPLSPDIATLAELGYPQAQVDDWYAFVARKGTPAQERDAFATAVREVMALREVQTPLVTTGHNPYVIGADQISQSIVAAKKRWADLIRETGYKIES